MSRSASPNLRSHWVFVYAGETPGIANRKIARFLDRTLLDVRARDDWPHAGTGRPMIEAFIATESAHWDEALRETLSLARRITPQWSLRLHDVDGDIHGEADKTLRNAQGGGCTIGGPACLLRVEWRLRRNQDYPRF
jgi:hypothetical protein